MVGQKKAVINWVMGKLPHFKQGQDNALLMLSNADLEAIKMGIYTGIMSGLIEYSKPITDQNEVMTYARSMVMNHLKKAKELNGGFAQGKSSSVKSEPKPLTNIDKSLLTEELKNFVETLV